MELILTVHVHVTDPISVAGKTRTMVMLPFTGEAEGPYFHGRILPNAVDTQTLVDGMGHISARYMLEGTDCKGNACRMFIENNGADFLHCHPTITTDSPLLQDLETAALFATVNPSEKEVTILIYRDHLKEFCDRCTYADNLRDAGLTEPEDLIKHKNIRYSVYDDFGLMDLYYPPNLSKPMPVIVHVHGGGYCYGGKELYRFYCMSLAQHGFAVINFNYRLTPNYTFPAPIKDTNTIMQWIVDHADVYGLDPQKVFIGGDSAGAQIASQYAAIWSDPAYAKLFDFTVPNITIKGALLNCGVYQTIRLQGGKKEQNPADLGSYYWVNVPFDEGGICDTEGHITKDYPPVYLMSCEYDSLKDFVPPMDALLTKKGVLHVTKIYTSQEEPLYHVFHIGIKSKNAQLCNDEECAFLKKLL